ncbi:lipoate--protein ligase family protein [Homoserinibacter sp. YIM 151385]|uniref:lipoate--protein ligase family protein n=1 Tax=Homoserinibacter sp. YIM 151385 TaxID=2985506 RepID=UPI0022F0E1F1|nr:biotin/lipoate A/B protein ligase family protein [Homoserinibacter sp. YIM 151385]WBU37125.1 biotin/lipoate A/B protein ligase family protein [Homoserinibacter sp. YIM 151385]
MHGEFKVPGGKLVVVDLEVVDGRIRDFRLAGDFFLEPDDALAAIDAAIEGLPAETDARKLAAAVQAALPEGAVLLGFAPESVATAIRRAITTTTDWSDYEWELLHPGPLPANMHLALDEVLTQEVGEGRRRPTLRIWEWSERTVVIGSFQSVRNEVDAVEAEREGFRVVRRISGGGAMYIEPGSAVTYSLYVPGELVQGMTFADSYAYLDDWVIQALQGLGIDAVYKPLNDISSPTGKIGGAAQKRLGGGGVLHHVTMSYDMDGEKMSRVLRIGREKLSDKGTTSAAKRVDPLRSQTGLPREEIIERMLDTFRSLHGLAPGELTPEELAHAEQLVADKFGTEEWLHRVP